MAVRDVDDDDVGAGAQQLGRALEIVARRADRRADTQTALRVARGKRQLALLEEILGRDEAGQRALRVDERQLLDLVGRASPLRPLRRRAGPRARSGAGRAASCALRPCRVAGTKRMSRVRQQAGRHAALSSTTTSEPTPVRRMSSAASRRVADGRIVYGSAIVRAGAA